MATDLWGDIPGVTDKRGPVDVLREQSVILEGKTCGHVRLCGQMQLPDKLLCLFDIVGIEPDDSDPICVVHGKDYPCLVSVGDTQRWANSEVEFMEIMRGIFQSDAVREKLADVIASAESFRLATEGGEK